MRFTTLFLSIALFASTIITSHAQDDISSAAAAFGKLPEITSAKISPDGTKILMMQNYQGKKILVTRSLTDLSAKQNGIPFTEGEFNWARWASNDRILASVRIYDRVNYSQVMDDVYSVDTTEFRLVSMNWDGEDLINPIRPVTDRARQPQNQTRVIDILKDDPKHILMTIDIEESYVYGVYKIDITKPRRPLKILRGREIIDNWETDANKVVRFGVGSKENRGAGNVRREAFYRKTEDSPWMSLYKLSGLNKDTPFYFEGFSQDPNIIYVTKDDENGRRAGYTYDVNNEKFIEKIIYNDEYDITSIHFDDDGNLEFYMFYDKQPRIVFINEEKQKLLDLLHNTFPNKSINFNGWTEDENKVVFEVTSPTEPGTYYIFDRANRKMEMLGYNYEGVDVEKISDMAPITYEARDGLTIPGYLSLPKGKDPKNLPTIILPHGGPMARDNWQFDFWTQFLTNQGYAVLQMNYRGSTGYGEKYRNLGDHEWGGKMLEDINDGTKWMIAQGYADPNRICITGGSYGGYAALQAVVKDPSLYKCSVAMAPVANLSSFLAYQKQFIGRKEYRDYIESENYTIEEASPIRNIDKINVPVLLLHGDKDRSVRIVQSQDFYKEMSSQGKDIKYIEWEGGDHFFSLQEHRVKFLKEMGEFLKKHL